MFVSPVEEAVSYWSRLVEEKSKLTDFTSRLRSIAIGERNVVGSKCLGSIRFRVVSEILINRWCTNLLTIFEPGRCLN